MARDTWRGLAELTDRENGLPVDHVRLSASLEPPDTRVGDYTNVTTVGLHLAAVVAAYDLGFVSENDAIARLAKVLDTLERLETYHGFFFNYYDTTSLERTSNFLSFVDSSWLTAGLMVVRSTFPALRRASEQADRRRRLSLLLRRGRPADVPRVLRQRADAVGVSLRTPLHGASPRQLDRHRQRRRARGALVRAGAHLSTGCGLAGPAPARVADVPRARARDRERLRTNGAASATSLRGAAACSRR